MFLLVQAFYSGALTMFFSSSEFQPFESLRQGLALYPTCNMLFTTNDIILVQPYAVEQKDPLYKHVWDDAQKPGYDIIQPDIQIALRKLLKPQHFIFTLKMPLLAAYKAAKISELDLKILSRKNSHWAVILGKHSPFTVILNRGK